jgi:glyoxylase-like metal-dependent hydrolase (beta-lactamase superfamily II)
MLEVKKYDEVTVFRSGREISGRVLYWVSFYYYGNVVFDTGCFWSKEEVREFFRNRMVEGVVITHHHEDHIGGASVFKKVFAPRKAIAIIKNPPKIPEYRQVVWGQPEPANAEPFEDKITFGDMEITVIETPGHEFDHVCFLIDGKLFSGDLVVSTGQIVCMKQENLVETIESLKKVLKFKFEFAFGGPSVTTKEGVKDYLNYLVELRNRARELYAEGRDVSEIVDILFPNPSKRALMMEFVSGGEWSRENFVRSLLGLIKK